MKKKLTFISVNKEEEEEEERLEEEADHYECWQGGDKSKKKVSLRPCTQKT